MHFVVYSTLLYKNKIVVNSNVIMTYVMLSNTICFIRTKMGMLRFDPLQPEHAKFLAPAEERQEQAKKSKKKKSKDKQEEGQPKGTKTESPTVEVSKEQFYNISETLKEAIKKPASFSLRSLFGNNEEERQEGQCVWHGDCILLIA